MTEILASQLSQYIDGLIPERAPELQAMEAWAKEHDFPIIGPACGHLCYQVARMLYLQGSGRPWDTLSRAEFQTGTARRVCRRTRHRGRSNLNLIG